MKKNTKNYKKLFNSLIIENDKKEKIYSNILNSKERKAYSKFAYIIPAIILVLFTGIIFADDIKFIFNSLVVKKIEKENSKGEKFNTLIYKSDSLAEINYDADLLVTDNTNNYNYYNIDKIENKLGITFVKNNMIKNKEMAQLTTIKNDNKIAFAVFKISNAYNETPVYSNSNETQYDKTSVLCDIVISLKTKYSTDEKLERWSNASEQVKIFEYYVKSIKTTALIKSYDELRSLREVLFDYNNVRYLISFTIPNDLDPNTEVLKFLNSLYI